MLRIGTPRADVDEKKGLSFDTVDSSAIVEEDANKSSINAGNAIGCSLIDELTRRMASLSLESAKTRLLQELLLRWLKIDGIMEPEQNRSVWSIIESLESFAASEAEFMKRYHCGENPFLASAIIRIALDIFAARSQLDESFNSELIERLLGKGKKDLPVALELLDRILSEKMIHSTLLEEKHVFDCFTALKTRYFESTVEDAEGIIQTDATIRSSTVGDMDEKNNSSLNCLTRSPIDRSTIDPIIIADVDEKNSPIDLCKKNTKASDSDGEVRVGSSDVNKKVERVVLDVNAVGQEGKEIRVIDLVSDEEEMVNDEPNQLIIQPPHIQLIIDTSEEEEEENEELQHQSQQPRDMCSSTTETDSLIGGISSLSLESTTKEAESIQSDATIRFTVDRVGKKNNSSFNTFKPIVMRGDEVDAKKSSTNVTDVCCPTTGIEELTKGVALLSPESTKEKAEIIIQSDAAIRKLGHSHPLHSYDNINAMRTGLPELEEATAHGRCAEKRRAQMVDWIFGLIAKLKKFECMPNLFDMAYFSAVCILDCSLMVHAERFYELTDEENRPVLIAAVKLAATQTMGSLNEEALCALAAVIDELGCRDEDIKQWEDRHPVNTNALTHRQSTHLLQNLHEHWCMIDVVMMPDEFQSGWSMIETLASFALSKEGLKRHNLSLLASAIIRIALDFLASRNQLEPFNSQRIERLLGKESEHMPIALELLDWVLSGEMILPALTEKIRPDFDCLAALKSGYLKSTAKEAESMVQSDATIRFALDDVDEKNVSLFNTYKPIITRVDEKKLRRSARRSIESLRSYDKIDVVRAGLPELEETAFQALRNSGLEELPIRQEVEVVRDGLRRNHGVRTRSISDQPFHLGQAESLAKFQNLHQDIEMCAEKKRARMVDWIFGFIPSIKKSECVLGVLNRAYFLAVDILDSSLMEHKSEIYKLFDEKNPPVLIATVKLAAKKEMGPVNEKELNTLHKVICKTRCNKKDIKYWEDKHAKALECNTNAPTQMQPTHLLEKLQEHWTFFNDIMKPDEFQSGWSMIEMLASFAVSKAGLLKRYQCGENLLLVSAIIRIALELFASRTQLDNPLDSELIEGLLGKESEHVPVALEFLDWVLSGKMILPALTRKMKDDFDFEDLIKISGGMRMSQSKKGIEPNKHSD